MKLQNKKYHLKAFSKALHCSWSKTRIFAASTITQYWLDNTIIIIFFSDKAIIIYWMKETNSCFLKIASKAPVRILQNLYTAFEWIWRSNLQISFFPDECFVTKWRLKFQVSKYRLRWNAENMTSSIMSPQKKYTNRSPLRLEID